MPSWQRLHGEFMYNNYLFINTLDLFISSLLRAAFCFLSGNGGGRYSL